MKKIWISILLLLTSMMAIFFVVGGMNIIPVIAPTVEHEENIGESFNFDSHFIEVLGSNMHYIDEGKIVGNGKTIVLVHGNPTSSYLWRNIIPKINEGNRVIAIDLIGMGKSDKPDIEYKLQDHIRYFDAFIEKLNLTNIVLVLHDWGGAIGVNYYVNHQDNTDGIIIMEAVIKPNYWKNADIIGEYLFRNLRDERVGYDLIVKDNYFVEKLLPMMSGRKLTEAEMNHYRSPYTKKLSRKPIRIWPLEIPIDKEPIRNHNLLEMNYELLKKANKPLIFLHGTPGLIFDKKYINELSKDFVNAEVKSVGSGLHYLQESQPSKISNLINDFIVKL